MDGGFTDAAVEGYLHKLQPAPDPLLREMEQDGLSRGFPIIGPLVGRLCEQLARGIGAKSVFEMGSGFGYSTAWFARAVGPKGTVVHTEGSRELSSQAKAYLERGGLAKQVEFRLGDAVELLRKDPATYDVVFVDIDKEGYPAAWDVARTKVRVGGLVVVDNVLWKGKVAGKSRDAATSAIREFNEAALSDGGFLGTIMPLRDGVGIFLRLR